ncbi:MAG: PIN domain-containing protein, partial [Pedobacter sp.]
MRYILDTHVLIWLITQDAQLKPFIKAVLFDQANEFYVSHESLREIVIKAKLNKPDFRLLQSVTISDIAKTLQETLGVKLLASKVMHMQQLEELMPIHSDPFDHLLICQAITENLIMISHDGNFPLYQSQGLHLL